MLYFNTFVTYLHTKAELYGAAGKGLYDPPRLSRSPLYFSIYAQGGLTIR